MPLQLYNTLTRKKEEFKPLDPKVVTFYTCGPTVYNYAHIGNFRAYLFEDILRRYLEYLGFTVRHCMNLTDVDDKTIKGSRESKKSLTEFTAQFKTAFFEDIKTLNILPAQVYPAATDHIQEIIQLIEVLLEKGYAYTGEDRCIYFNIRKFKEYGKLAHITLENLKAGARISHDEYDKEHAADFALWKAWDANDGDVSWESPFGKGRPGWHIECSAMSMKHLSAAFSQGSLDPSLFKTIDIHCGGVDNKFPHHEDEIAQSEAVCGRPFVHTWLHCEHLLSDGKKMSKSLGNFYTLRDLIGQGYKPEAIRYCLLATHYRQQANFTIEELKASEQAVLRLQEFIWNLQEAKGSGPDVNEFIDEAKTRFEESMNNDLSIHQALSGIFTFVKDINILLSEHRIHPDSAKEILEFLHGVNSILGVLTFTKETLDPQIMGLIEKREEARKNKDFASADFIRKKLDEIGIILDDAKDGVRWKRK